MGGYWINVAQDKDYWQTLMHIVMHFCGPQYAGNFMNSSAIVSFTEKTVALWSC
jgi:hypothetical protein